MRLLAKLLVGAAALVVALVVFTAVNGRSGPSAAGAPPGHVVAVLPGASTDARIAALQANLRAHVGRGDQLSALGDAYLQKVRETGDYAYYSRAQQAYGQALARDGRDVAATIGKGTLALGRHDFRAGLVAGRRARAPARSRRRPRGRCRWSSTRSSSWGATTRPAACFSGSSTSSRSVARIEPARSSQRHGPGGPSR